MRVLFMGTPLFAKVILEAVCGEFEVVGLFCQPDKPSGRKQEIQMPPTKTYVLQSHPSIPIFQPESFDEEIYQKVAALKPDVIVVVAYGKILPSRLLAHRCINLHASILPKYRGASPIQEMILQDDAYFGVTAMAMEEGLDCGDILGISLCKNDHKISLGLLSEKLAQMGAGLIKEVLCREDLLPLAQDEIHSSYCKKIKKENGLVEFEDARKLERFSRAYEGWPQVFLQSGLKLFGIEIREEQGSHKKGEILEITTEKIAVGCVRGSVWIKFLQAPNKQKVRAVDYVNGRRLQVGMVLE
ncbi:methionyl-tRNA formyltransferase [Helicobacter mustelae]|uniref:Methionyl-tRNA formyltransferase n=1 Tax=Helicobacter mustelae (strain ATCC 43772 / CCUG 25715 / CIP 103759 / LMG 18044 / NCTC 12198 / R85-136P) TaxID=679897 RepID=D3UGR7_HELM1|nr:methionyl-tRNA formyltransferase [Helicobacter mustelae]CBG39688.1 methionyl-tRNA formyltransferase [Helicobacter mustelae 12198]SQH71194.1 methionyl-tRNA formyltransferase [Helicobacter mustelae]